jgi:biotin carboxylase
LADEFVQVPGGSNNNNYANIRLIVDIAERTGVQAVWPGWGHASENDRLPELLALTKNKIVWIGPPPEAMRALGDKIGSTLIAQSAGVPCVGWSGSGLTVNYKKHGLPADLYASACVRTTAEAVACAERIGFPIMIKASEGGGGKGIRKVENVEDVQLAFPQVQGEVPGSPIFLMKLAPSCRHLEVQLLADRHHSAIAIFGRGQDAMQCDAQMQFAYTAMRLEAKHFVSLYPRVCFFLIPFLQTAVSSVVTRRSSRRVPSSPLLRMCGVAWSSRPCVWRRRSVTSVPVRSSTCIATMVRTTSSNSTPVCKWSIR